MMLCHRASPRSAMCVRNDPCKVSQRFALLFSRGGSVALRAARVCALVCMGSRARPPFASGGPGRWVDEGEPLSAQLALGWTSRRALHRVRKLSRRHSRCGCRVPPPQDACAAGEGRLHPQQRSSGFYGNFSGYSVLTRDGRHIFAIFSHCSALRRFLRGIPCRGTAGLAGPRPFPTIAERSRRAQRSRVSFALACSCRRGVDETDTKMMRGQ